MAKLAFLGTGMIGGGLAEAAARRGDAVVAYNRTTEKAEALRAFGVRVAASLADAVTGAERVHITLNDDAAVDATLAQCIEHVGDAVVIDHTTASAVGSKARVERLAAKGVAFLHAPVFMSPQGCRDGVGIMLAAGPKAVYERASEGLAKMTGTVKYLGERGDLAAAYKLFGNTMIIAITAGLADVFAQAASLGLTPQDALSLFEAFNPANVLAYRGKRMANADYQAAFELSMARKDVRLMIEAAGAQPLATLPGIAARMDELIKQGYASDDLGILSVGSVPKPR